MPEYLRFIMLLAAGWINNDQQKIIDFLIEEIRVYREHFKGRRLRFTGCLKFGRYSLWIKITAVFRRRRATVVVLNREALPVSPFVLQPIPLDVFADNNSILLAPRNT